MNIFNAELRSLYNQFVLFCFTFKNNDHLPSRVADFVMRFQDSQFEDSKKYFHWLLFCCRNIAIFYCQDIKLLLHFPNIWVSKILELKSDSRTILIWETETGSNRPEITFLEVEIVYSMLSAVLQPALNFILQMKI